MPSVLSLKCDCGVRLSIVTEKTSGASPQTTVIPCPTRNCKAKHLVEGIILNVFIVDDDGQSTPCDWKGVQQLHRVD
jgi:hypothetical protein